VQEMKLKLERTVSWQVEGPDESYCATTYSRRDAVLVASLARKIRGLKCLKEGSTGKQPKGLYLYIKRGGERYPAVETYDPRLDRAVRKVQHLLKGEA
jgi:hypothetical protein